MIANEHLGRGTTQFDTWNLTARAATQIGTAAVTLCAIVATIVTTLRQLYTSRDAKIKTNLSVARNCTVDSKLSL